MDERLWDNLGNATLADVAKHAGVSAMTVSHALSRPDKFAGETLN